MYTDLVNIRMSKYFTKTSKFESTLRGLGMQQFVEIYSEIEILDPRLKNTLIQPTRSGLILVERGFIRIAFNEKSHDYQAGHVMFITPKDSFYITDYSADLKTSTILYKSAELRASINFDFNRYDVYRIATSQIVNNNFVIAEPRFTYLIEILNQLRYYIYNEEVLLKSPILNSLFTAFFSSILSFLLEKSKERIRPGSRKEEIATAFIHLLSEHFRKERELQFYADNLCISTKYIFMSVKETTGRSPRFLIDSFTLDEAKNLLLNTRNTISQISTSLHFSDQYAFGKYFKKHTGLSPIKFRRQQKNVITI